MSESKLLRGTFVLTAATFISKFLGMIYVFPFHALVGNTGGALYAYAYVPYTILLSVATMGVPLAVSKFVSKYNTLGDYETGRRLFRSGMLLMTLTGLGAFIFLYALAPSIAPLVIGEKSGGNSLDDVVLVIRMVSTALIIVPMMSLIRGFFQGHQSMGPTAVSQVIEQIVRIIFLLSASYLVIEVFRGKLSTAIGLSTFAAFVGAVGGLIVLIIYWRKRKSYLDELLFKQNGGSNPTLKDMYKELLSYAGPFVLVGLAIPLYQLVDTLTFNRTMIEIGKATIAESAYSMFTLWNHKLVMIPVSLATAFALTLVPTITNSYTSGNYQQLHKQITQTLQVIVFLILPAVIGLSVLAYPAYGTFFDSETLQLGGYILRWYAPVALLFALFSVTAAILQGLDLQRYAVYSLLLGLIIKVVLNIPFIKLYETIGAVTATGLGFSAAVLMNLFIIGKYIHYSYSFFIRRSLLIAIFVLFMAIGVSLVQWGLANFIIPESGRIQSTVILFVSVISGAVIYLWLSVKTNLLSKILGQRLTILKKWKGGS